MEVQLPRKDGLLKNRVKNERRKVQKKIECSLNEKEKKEFNDKQINLFLEEFIVRRIYCHKNLQSEENTARRTHCQKTYYQKNKKENKK